jgi:hypothetical protein
MCHCQENDPRRHILVNRLINPHFVGLTNTHLSLLRRLEVATAGWRTGYFNSVSCGALSLREGFGVA